MDFSPMSYSVSMEAAHTVNTEPDSGTYWHKRVYPSISSVGESNILTGVGTYHQDGVSPSTAATCMWGGAVGHDVAYTGTAVTFGTNLAVAKNCSPIFPVETSVTDYAGAFQHPYDFARNTESVVMVTGDQGLTGCGGMRYTHGTTFRGFSYLLRMSGAGESGAVVTGHVRLSLDLYFLNTVYTVANTTESVFSQYRTGTSIIVGAQSRFNSPENFAAEEELVSNVYPEHTRPGSGHTLEECGAPTRWSVLYGEPKRQLWSKVVSCGDLTDSIELPLLQQVDGWYSGVPSLWNAIGIRDIPATITVTPVAA